MQKKYKNSNYDIEEKKMLFNYFESTKKFLIQESQKRRQVDLDIERIVDLSKGKKLVGWGAGSFAEDFIQVNKILEFSYLIDSFKAEEDFCDYRIFKPEKLLGEEKEDIFIVVLSSFVEEIDNWLVEHEFIREVHYY